MAYAKRNGFLHPQFFIDDGISGTTFERADFKRMQFMIENGEVSTVIVKDLSRFGRNPICKWANILKSNIRQWAYALLPYRKMWTPQKKAERK